LHFSRRRVKKKSALLKSLNSEKPGEKPRHLPKVHLFLSREKTPIFRSAPKVFFPLHPLSKMRRGDATGQKKKCLDYLRRWPFQKNESKKSRNSRTIKRGDVQRKGGLFLLRVEGKEKRAFKPSSFQFRFAARGNTTRPTGRSPARWLKTRIIRFEKERCQAAILREEGAFGRRTARDGKKENFLKTRVHPKMRREKKIGNYLSSAVAHA